MPLVSEVLNVKATEGHPPAKESEFWTSCPGCGVTMRLHRAVVDTTPMEVTYACANQDCRRALLVVSTPGVIEWEGRGYRVGEWMIRNTQDLFYLPLGAAVPVKFPASPQALD
jgi:hypothetical protein